MAKITMQKFDQFKEIPELTQFHNIGESPDNVGTHGSCVQLGRKSPRANFHDYSGGDYFITICTKDKIQFFGNIQNGEMLLTEIGKYCHQQIEDLPGHYPYVKVPLFVVMPNHIHAIICINSAVTHQNNRRTHGPCVPTVRTALSVVVSGLKRAVTMFARRNNIEFDWQSRYHDHIIRGTNDGNRIAEYIENNVVRWDTDCFKSN